jgi:uncharacterized protein YunC (DUF1805 family)
VHVAHRPVLITRVAPVAATTVSTTVSINLAGLAGSTKKSGVLCQLCIDEVLALINEVLNDILNGIILNSCGKLCGAIQNNATKELCTIACDVVGIKKLVEYLNSTARFLLCVCGNVGLRSKIPLDYATSTVPYGDFNGCEVCRHCLQIRYIYL